MYKHKNINEILIKRQNNIDNKKWWFDGLTDEEYKELISKDNLEEIKTLEKTIEDLKSQVIILQSKLLDYDLQNPERKSVEHKMQNINITTDRQEPPISYTYNNFQDDVVIYDPIANYDRLKLTDPFVDPRGRSSADQIPTPQVAAQLNFPTQGVIDRYHRVGLLIAVDNDDDYRYYDRNNRLIYAKDYIDYINKSK